MSNDDAIRRRIRIFCDEKTLEGDLGACVRLRTIDELNSATKNFLHVSSPKVVEGSWTVTEAPLAVNKSSVFFVHELSAPAQFTDERRGGFERAPIQLHVGPYTVQGFVHIPPGGSAMKRMDQDQLFLALTTALIRGPGGDFTTPFVAVNKTHVVAAQEAGVPAPA